MKITKLTIDKLQIPFKQSFSHASATRAKTEAVLVKAVSDKNLMGYGEGCPRVYVTGETIRSAFDFFSLYKYEILKISNLLELELWVQQQQTIIDQNPAAWCAIELSILDLLGKENKQTIESLLLLPPLSGEFRYTAVLGTDHIDIFSRQLKRYTDFGCKDFKLKISSQLEHDKNRVNLLRKLGSEIRIRLDANNTFKIAKEAIDYIQSLAYQFFAIEEPLKVGDFTGFKQVYEKLDLPIILDESFCRLQQLDIIKNQPEPWILNLRISKLGGILRTIVIAKKAKSNNIPLIVGAQVGETSILSRAALTIANNYRDILLAHEGAFGTYLLERDVSNNSIMFGQGAKIKATMINCMPGLWEVDS